MSLSSIIMQNVCFNIKSSNLSPRSNELVRLIQLVFDAFHSIRGQNKCVESVIENCMAKHALSGRWVTYTAVKHINITRKH